MREPEYQQFTFCPDDIERCVKGYRRKWIEPFSNKIDRPPIPDVWPVKIGTKLTLTEIMALEDAGFQLPQKETIPPNRLFNSVAPFPQDYSNVPVPPNPDAFPKSRKSKNFKRTLTAPSAKMKLNIGSAAAMQATVLKVMLIPQPGFGCAIRLQSKPSPTLSVYDAMISSYPDCSCESFQTTMAELGRKGKPFRPCKHLYYVLITVCGFDPKVHLFIHHMTYNFNEIKLALESGILAFATA